VFEHTDILEESIFQFKKGLWVVSPLYTYNGRVEHLQFNGKLPASYFSLLAYSALANFLTSLD